MHADNSVANIRIQIMHRRLGNKGEIQGQHESGAAVLHQPTLTAAVATPIPTPTGTISVPVALMIPLTAAAAAAALMPIIWCPAAATVAVVAPRFVLRVRGTRPADGSSTIERPSAGRHGHGPLAQLIDGIHGRTRGHYRAI